MILACDAGFANTGLAVIGPDTRLVAMWTLRTKPFNEKRHFYVADDDVKRTQDIVAALKATVERYRIRCLIAELPTGGSLGARALRCMALATGAVVSVAELMSIPAVWVTPLQVKGVARKMSATKAEVEAAVLENIPGLANHPAWVALQKGQREHVADALAAFLASKRHPLVLSILREPRLAVLPTVTENS